MSKSTVEILKDLISFKTTGDNLSEINRCANYICNILQEFNISPIVIPNKETGKPSIFAHISGPKDMPGIILNGHFDVVPANNDWETDPYTGIEKENRIYGRGTSDMKGFLASVLGSLQYLKNTDLKKPIYLAFCPDEETDDLGVGDLIEYMKKNNYKGEIAIIGETTSEMQNVYYKNRGIYDFQIDITGVSAHSSRPETGENAIVITAKIINQLDNLLNSEMKDKQITGNIGIVNGGTAGNTIPDACSIIAEFRFMTQSVKNEVLEKINSIIENVLKDFPKGSAKFIQLSNLPAFEKLPFAEEFVRKIDFPMNEVELKQSYTDAGKFTENGIPAIIIGPGTSGTPHKKNEYIEVTGLNNCDQFMKKLAEYASN